MTHDGLDPRGSVRTCLVPVFTTRESCLYRLPLAYAKFTSNFGSLGSMGRSDTEFPLFAQVTRGTGKAFSRFVAKICKVTLVPLRSVGVSGP